MAMTEEMRLAIKLTAQDTTKQAFGSLTHSLNGLKNTAMAVAAVVGTALIFKDVIDSTVRWSEKLDTLMDNLGLSAREASKWATQAEIVGLSIEELDGSMGALTRKLNESLPLIAKGEDDFSKWGVAVRDANGDLLQIPQIVDNIAGRMREMGTATERNMMAVELLGRSGRQLQDFLLADIEEMKSFMRTSREWDEALGTGDVDAVQKFAREMRFTGTLIEKLKVAVGMALLPVVRILLEALRHGAGVVKIFAEALRAPLSIIKEVVERLGTFIKQIKEQGFLTALVNLAKDIMTKIGEVLGNIGSWISENWPKWRAAIGDLWAKLKTWIADVGWPGLVATLGENAPKLARWIVDTIPIWITNLGILLGDIANWFLTDFAPAFLTGLNTALPKLKEWLDSTMTWWIKKAAPSFFSAGTSAGQSIVTGIMTGIAETWSNLLKQFFGLIKDLPGAAGAAGAIGGAILNPPPGIPNTFYEQYLEDVQNTRYRRGESLLNQWFPNLATVGTAGGGGGSAHLMASGGIVTRPTLGLMGESGPEAIIPLNRGLPATINIYVSGNVTRSEDELAEIVAGRVMRAMHASGQVGGSPMGKWF